MNVNSIMIFAALFLVFFVLKSLKAREKRRDEMKKKDNEMANEYMEETICPSCNLYPVQENGICIECYSKILIKLPQQQHSNETNKQESVNKFCIKCGHNNEEGFKFCSACGYQANVGDQDGVKKSKPIFISENISDNGKGNSKIGIVWLVFLLRTAVYIGVGLFFYNLGAPVRAPDIWGAQGPIIRSGNYWLMLMALIVMIVEPIITLFATISRATGISVTKINVCENEVYGTSGKLKGSLWLGYGGVSNKKFRLTYDKISSVTQTSNSVIVHSYGVSHEVYVIHPAGIANAINKRLKYYNDNK